MYRVGGPAGAKFERLELVTDRPVHCFICMALPPYPDVIVPDLPGPASSLLLGSKDERAGRMLMRMCRGRGLFFRDEDSCGIYLGACLAHQANLALLHQCMLQTGKVTYKLLETAARHPLPKISMAS